MVVILNSILQVFPKHIIKEIQNEGKKQHKYIESENKIVKQQASKLRKLSNMDNQVNNEELEQYGRRVCP